MATSTRSRRLPRTTSHVTLRTRLARLNLAAVEKLLGDKASDLLRTGDCYLDDLDLNRDVYLRGDLFRLTIRDPEVPGGAVRVTMT
ncbi:MAG TPA: hypothetical protein ENJ50_08750 [Planctomycetaceae bacterium]|nr:hypothetical protein [Planctomycetaceae bacterium]